MIHTGSGYIQKQNEAVEICKMCKYRKKYIEQTNKINGYKESLEDEKEAIHRLEKFKTIKVLYGNTFAMHIEQLNELQSNIETILNLIQKQQSELRKKSRIIDEMARLMSEARVGRRMLACDFGKECNENGCRVCIKQYFTEKVEEIEC